MVGHDGRVTGLIGEEVAIDFADGHENVLCACMYVFLASSYGWVTVMHEIPISSAQPVDIPSIP